MLDEPTRTESPMSVGDWVLTIFITSIPLVGTHYALCMGFW